MLQLAEALPQDVRVSEAAVATDSLMNCLLCIIYLHLVAAIINKGCIDVNLADGFQQGMLPGTVVYNYTLHQRC